MYYLYLGAHLYWFSGLNFKVDMVAAMALRESIVSVRKLSVTAVLTAASLLWPSAVFAQDPPEETISYDILLRYVTVTGTDQDDILRISPEGNDVRVTISTAGEVKSFPFPADRLDGIEFRAGAGDDQAVNESLVHLFALGGPGNDSLSGGGGNDVLVGGPGNDNIVGGAGKDVLIGGSGNDIIAAGEGDDQAFGGSGVDAITGDLGNDFIDGQDDNDILAGGDGNDVIFGAMGNDFIRGGEGSDSLNGGQGDDIIEGEAGVDVIAGGNGNDTLKGGTENDLLTGGLGDDVMTGNENNDVLRGGKGDDILSGHDGEDELWGGDGNDGLDGGFGPDEMHGGPGNDIMIGGPQNDLMFGDEGDDFLLGASDVDQLDGGVGDDILEGDLEDTLLNGGPGKNKVGTDRKSKFGIVPNPSNEPLSTTEDVLRSFQRAGTLTDNISLFWPFRSQGTLEERLNILDAIEKSDKTSFMQLGVQFFGDPLAPVGLPTTFGHPKTRAKFLENVKTIAERKPDLMNLGAELNFLYWLNPTEFAHYATLYQEAYKVIKAVSPKTLVGATFHYTLYRACEQLEALEALVTYDYVGFTVYPIWMLDTGLVDDVDKIPTGWWRWMRDTYPDDKIVIGELGMPSSVNSNPQEQAQFIRKIPEIFAGIDPEFVSWILLSNVGFFNPELLGETEVNFLLDVGVDPDILFGRLNNNGLHTIDGIPLPGWFEAIKLDLDSYTGPLQDTIQLMEQPELCSNPPGSSALACEAFGNGGSCSNIPSSID